MSLALLLHSALILPPALSIAPLGAGGAAQEERPEKQEKKGAGANLVGLPEGYVRFGRVPENGLFPRVAYRDGAVVVLYFRGDPAGGDLVLARSGDEGVSFSEGVRVNPEEGSVVALETFHPGGVDLGPDGLAHVAWISAADGPRLYYVHESAEGLAPVLDLGAPAGLAGNVALAVGPDGRVFLFYSTATPDPQGGEDPVTELWSRRSPDGVHFSDPVTVGRGFDGVSQESMISAHVDVVKGLVYALYRGSHRMRPGQPGMLRPMILLISDDGGDTFESSRADNHKQQRDPRSLSELSQDDETVLATWEGNGLVCWSLIRRAMKKVNLPVEPKSDEPLYRSKPTAISFQGEILMAWLERPKEDREAAPRLAWKVWLKEGRLPQGQGLCPDAPGERCPVAFPRREGGFTILY